MSAYKRKDRDGWYYYRRWVHLPDGSRVKVRGKAPLNTRASAVAAEEDHVKRVRNPAPQIKPVAMPTVTEYATGWLARRTNANAGDDRTRITRHALPQLGDLAMDAVKPRHLRDLVLKLREAGHLAPTTIRQVTGLLHTMFKSAQIEEVIPSNPVVFERGTLPKKADKDPTWRHEAIYTREEIATLISDERILPDRRVLYALKSLGALRHSEAAKLTWSQYDHNASPLGSINLGETKSGKPRAVPVHPTLAKILAAWKLSGWAAVYGRTPKADDLIVPTRNMTAENPRGTARKPTESQNALIADLEMLGLRVKAGRTRKRRGHDMRRTFVTLARTDGAIDSLLRWTTHGPTGDMLDVYSSPPWAARCAEVAKLKIEMPEGRVIEMRPSSSSSRWLKPPATPIATNRTPDGPRKLAAHASTSQPAAMLMDFKATPTATHANGTGKPTRPLDIRFLAVAA